MVNLKNNFVKCISWVIILYFVLSPTPLQHLVNNEVCFHASKMAFANKSVEEDQKLFRESEEFWRRVSKVERKPWYKDWKIWVAIISAAAAIGKPLPYP